MWLVRGQFKTEDGYASRRRADNDAPSVAPSMTSLQRPRRCPMSTQTESRDARLRHQAPQDVADLDNDGDLDFVVGDDDGLLAYMENTGTSTAPVFVASFSSASDPFHGIDVIYDRVADANHHRAAARVISTA